MSALFGGGPKIQMPEPARPLPRDDASREAAERMRRQFQESGRRSTVLTRGVRRSQGAGAAPRRTVIGGG